MSRNQGINIGGDGMGGRLGASRGWGFGDDSDGDENAVRYTTKGGRSAAGTEGMVDAGMVKNRAGDGKGPYERGLQMRTQVLGKEFVEKSLRETQGNEFMGTMIGFATETAWSQIWTRPGLELKTRSLLNLVMLTALGHWTELGTHVLGALRNGATETEIREALLQAAAYCGMPAGMEAFRVADRVIKERKRNGEM